MPGRLLIFFLVGWLFPSLVVNHMNKQGLNTPKDSGEGMISLYAEGRLTDRDVRNGVLPHIIMDAGMVFMLLFLRGAYARDPCIAEIQYFGCS